MAFYHQMEKEYPIVYLQAALSDLQDRSLELRKQRRHEQLQDRVRKLLHKNWGLQWHKGVGGGGIHQHSTGRVLWAEQRSVEL